MVNYSYIRVKKKKPPGLKWLFYPVIGVTIVMILLLVSQADFGTQRPGALLKNSLNSMMVKNDIIQAIIEEKGAGYRLTFVGSMKSGQFIRGMLEEYELQVYRRNDGDMLIRGSEEVHWTYASEAGLEDLGEFTASPFEMLLEFDCLFEKAEYADSYIGSKAGSAVMLELPAASLPGGAVNNSQGENYYVRCLVLVAEDAPFIEQISMEMVEKSSGSLNIKLERTYTFKNM